MPEEGRVETPINSHYETCCFHTCAGVLQEEGVVERNQGGGRWVQGLLGEG